MYVLGHTAFAYILTATVYSASSKKLRPEIVFYVFVFSNILDALHVGLLRTVVHNLAGTVLFAGFWMYFFYRYRLIGREHVPVLSLAAGTHVLADYLFSGYSFFFPLDHTVYQIYGFNSFEDLFAESILGISFLILFLGLGDNSRLKEFLHEERRKLAGSFTLRRAYDPHLFPFYAYVVFLSFSAAQLPILITLNLERLMDQVWYAWLFLLVLVLFLILLGVTGFGEDSDEPRNEPA